MTPVEIAGAIGFFLTVSGALWGIWWRIEGQIRTAKIEATARAESAYALAAMARQEVQDLRLEVATNYATKAGMHEQTAQMLRAIEGVASRIDGLNERLDNIILQRPETRSRSA